ncbi:MAG: thiamine phosphate synthase [Alphaproteobacteria bacterium]|nr:thiamine phosphate synthase [Alphaproteobacteria bacterium]
MRATPAGQRCRLYLITPPALQSKEFAGDLAEALDTGDVAAVQLRLKDATADQVRQAIDVLRPVAQEREVAFILNDDPALAAETDCDGVHVGQDDAPCREARRIVGPDRIVGVSCHDSRHLAMTAGESGADYVAFGAFFPTQSKLVPAGVPEPEILSWWSELFEIPCVAIGGITPENCGTLVRAGADFIAVITAVWSHDDGPGAAVAAFNRAITQAMEQQD